eukprot:CAMPEP_0182517968 /NCGR_PEP_ID=MMETSP1321-20130603/43270_1 /TAXON_ID=91990 /ORGANISM="Bolidomonas sp., Strain RCC1657" /LENGTH=36 /DNA_ID= /DNA_START= /DNA_END= /DNA_ORIENTATION=
MNDDPLLAAEALENRYLEILGRARSFKDEVSPERKP